MVMVPIIVNEGREALRGEQCGDCHSQARESERSI
jgi:hypothetical protein